MGVRRVFPGVLLVLLGSCVTASIPDPTPINVITLDQTVYFLTPEGESIQVAPGIYSVTEAEKNALWLSKNTGETVVRVAANEQVHEESLSHSVGWSSSGKEDQYQIVLLLPENRGLVATGSFSGIRSKGTGNPPKLTAQQLQGQLKSRLTAQPVQPTNPKLLVNPALLKPDVAFYLVDFYQYAPPFSSDPDPNHIQKIQGFFDQRDDTWYISQWDVEKEGWFYLTWNRVFPESPKPQGPFQKDVGGGIQKSGGNPQVYEPETYTEIRLKINGSWATYGTAEKKPDGDVFITPLQNKSARAMAFPWTMQLFVTTSKGKTLISAVTKVALKPVWSWFEVKLAPIVRHDRCTSCHSLGDQYAIVKYHNDRGFDLKKEWFSVYPIEPQLAQGCLTCHAPFSADWRSPKFIQGLNWTSGLPPKSICEKMTGPFTDKDGNVGPPVDLHHHFHDDPRIIWAVSDGRVPRNHPTKPVLFPGNKELFFKAVDKWIEGGKPCPKTGAMDGQ